ncbi:MAG: exodeoxyribonuclease III [Chloroflexi bacterium]|uniref:Exodeoxyribonuclease III n=1 Tax=Candidatus Chlorohelix allophototropha TaxID=3003348 RepID=A0A8T7M5L9_9CHLR|nr:exodeoxyribonuclease III [Chloroflexota bacterium]WJW69273.1 exodeoxyribonuclease III [Chloroflexota bacterium L227-S17]
MKLTLASWNVNSVNIRLPHLVRWLESRQPDVLCLQEIKCTDDKFPVAAIAPTGYSSFVFGQPGYNGVALLVKTSLAEQVADLQIGFPGDTTDPSRRLVAATVAGVRVINVYVPNGQEVGSEKFAYKLDWFTKLREDLISHWNPAQKLAILGDFNVAPASVDVHDPKAREGKILVSQPERDALESLKTWGLYDSFRTLNPDKVAYSWWDYRENSFRRNLGLRIDHILVSESLLQSCRASEIDPEPRSWERPSDHTPVFAVFE